jgi:integral membrane protein
MNKKNLLKQLRLLAILEGISYLLFALTMPLKYMYEIGMPNKIVGMAHGILFIAYCAWVVLYGKEVKWAFKTTFLGLLASLFPFATFIFDSKVLKKEGQ